MYLSDAPVYVVGHGVKDWRCVVVIKAWGGGVVVVELRTWQVRCMGRGGC